MEARQALRQRIAIVLRWSRLLILCSVIAGTTAWGINQHQTPIYQAATTILIDAAPGTKPTSDYQSILGSERQAQTYGQLLISEPLLENVIQKLSLPRQADDLRRSIDVSVVRDTQLIHVQVRDPNAQLAADIANTLVSTFTAQTHEMQTARYASSQQRLEQQMAVLDKQTQQMSSQLGGLKDIPENKGEHDRLDTTLAQYHQSYANLLQSYEQVRMAEAQTIASVVQVEPAITSQRPVAPRVLFNTLATAAVALLLAIGFALLYDLLDDRVKSPDEVSQQLGLPILGFINHAADISPARPLVDADPHSSFAEAFRSLRSNLQFATAARPVRTLLITSPTESDGKSTLVANLASVLAHTGKHVIVIDADLRHPRLHRRFDLRNSSGLSDLLVQPELQLDMLRSTAVNGVRLLTAGASPHNPAELLASDRLADVLAHVQPHADFVLIDSPPLLAVADAAILAQHVDGVILVVRVAATKLPACKQAAEQLHRANAHLLGVVLNDIPQGQAALAYGYSGYEHDERYASRSIRSRSPSAIPISSVGQHQPAESDRLLHLEGDSVAQPPQ
ncbi:MAG: polysaccharide biosynthesis tyrosine autokinase [Herpetosiphonaceae bacterium]|nr:polysaccharide biosynthesis tyrosine autokinase [Herpetosiphonaceae bacterium]